ncbi:HzsA-related protein [Novipirellula artificiosorum]|uniref:Translocation protein TolB n=1 Tax=Novipirellula artificiosorum TaxID=2528016 RepID=A0A5C6DS90_9BACT|nr:hypothetical protein [Novipirellula artificiosorum]TWU38361.1 translocation protein TolB [Novipirellula artificiosorum]
MKPCKRAHARSAIAGITLLLIAPLASLRAAESDASLRMDPWHCIGPFKDAAFGSLVTSSRHLFDAEADVLSCGRDAADLSRQYALPSFPGYEKLTSLAWQKHSEWSDGWRHLLPRGPAPSRHETVYLYRTLTVPESTSVTMRLYAEDAVTVWLNGKKVGAAIRNYGPEHRPCAVVEPLNLLPGKNRLLVKITCLFGSHGFAFALDGVTVSNPLLPTDWDKEHIRLDPKQPPLFSPADRPLNLTHADEPSDDAAYAARLRKIRFEVEQQPMFDPEHSVMEQMCSELPPSDGAEAYLRSLRDLRPQVTAALVRNASDAALGDANEAVESHWIAQSRACGPILFMRHPPYRINAIAPHTSGGATPSAICVWDPEHPQDAPRVVFEEEGLSLFDMNLSYDARTLFFSARRSGVEGGWHVYEIGVDGSNLRQITSGPSSDISPLPLPNGRIVFISDRASTFVQCQAHTAPLLYSCARDGSDIRRLSGNIDSDHSPQIMDDGRILFTRWDYGIEKNVDARHALWTMNPDGTEMKLFFGNTIEDPCGFWEARPVPGRPEIVCAFGPHHNYHAGMAGLVWNGRGPEAPRGEGFRFITTERPFFGDTTVPYGWQDLFPVHERLFLASYGGDGGHKNRLYLLDDRGNRKCLYEAEGELGCWNPIRLAPTAVPPTIAQTCTPVPWQYRDPEEMNLHPDSDTGTLLLYDVYQGIAPDVARGEAKWIQVMEQVQKSRRMADGEAWGHTPIISRGTVHVRREVGLVPIEADGSAHFTVPALRSLSLNVLDEEGMALMRMGSDMHVMPGEMQSCIGCHENRSGGVPPSSRARQPLAAMSPPVTPVMADWGTDGIIDYQKVVQPVWDAYCVSCHSGQQPEAGIDLSGDRTRFFCQSYDHLVERALVDWFQPFANDYDENSPKTVGAIISRLRLYLLDPEHCGKTIPPEMRRRVWAWIDANVPYYGTYDYAELPDASSNLITRGPGARCSWQTDGNWDAKSWRRSSGGRPHWFYDGVKTVFDKRCMSCHVREAYNGGTWGFGGGPMDKPMPVTSRLWEDRGLCAHMATARYGTSILYGPEFRINLTHPENSAMLLAPLAKQAGGWGLCQQSDGKPVFADSSDTDYQTMLRGMRVAQSRLYTWPRVDMPPTHVDAVRGTLVTGTDFGEPQAESPALSAGLSILPNTPKGAVNLARASRATSDDDVPAQQASDTPDKAIDGNPQTYWDDRDGAAEYDLSVTFTEPTSLSVLSMTGWRHEDFSPCDFTLLADGKPIGKVRDAVYAENQLILRFPTIRCSRFSLRITACYGGSPAIRELELYE